MLRVSSNEQDRIVMKATTKFRVIYNLHTGYDRHWPNGDRQKHTKHNTQNPWQQMNTEQTNETSPQHIHAYTIWFSVWQGKRREQWEEEEKNWTPIVKWFNCASMSYALDMIHSLFLSNGPAWEKDAHTKKDACDRNCTLPSKLFWAINIVIHLRSHFIRKDTPNLHFQ